MHRQTLYALAMDSILNPTNFNGHMYLLMYLYKQVSNLINSDKMTGVPNLTKSSKVQHLIPQKCTLHTRTPVCPNSTQIPTPSPGPLVPNPTKFIKKFIRCDTKPVKTYIYRNLPLAFDGMRQLGM